MDQDRLPNRPDVSPPRTHTSIVVMARSWSLPRTAPATPRRPTRLAALRRAQAPAAARDLLGAHLVHDLLRGHYVGPVPRRRPRGAGHAAHRSGCGSVFIPHGSHTPDKGITLRMFGATRGNRGPEQRGHLATNGPGTLESVPTFAFRLRCTFVCYAPAPMRQRKSLGPSARAVFNRRLVYASL